MRLFRRKISTFSNKKFKIEIPVHSAEPGKHDLIAGCPGSFAQTMAGIHHLLETGVEVGIRIVVSRLNYQELNSIIQFIHQEFPAVRYINIMGMEVLGNAWKNREIVWIEMDELKFYLQSALEESFRCGIEPGLYNFPLCLFDRKYWYCYKNSISDYKIRYLRSHASHSSSSHSSHGSHSNHNSHSSGSHSSGGSSHSSGSNTTATVKLPKMQTPQSTPSMQ